MGIGSSLEEVILPAQKEQVTAIRVRIESELDERSWDNIRGMHWVRVMFHLDCICFIIFAILELILVIVYSTV